MKKNDATSRAEGTSGPSQTTDADEKRQIRDPSAAATAEVLDDLRRALGRVTALSHPRTFKLLRSGNRKHTRKLIEEACEVTIETVKRNKAGIVLESADLLYHLVLLWFRSGIEPEQIWQEMQRRADTLGIAEKLPKCIERGTLPANFRH